MKPSFYCLVICTLLAYPLTLFAQNESRPALGDSPRVYTFGNQVDYTPNASASAKDGATVLAWQKSSRALMAEIEIFNKDVKHKPKVFLTESNFLHVVVYFKNSYEWRVRYVDSEKKPVTAFSKPTPFRVVPRKGNSVVAHHPVLAADPSLRIDVKTGALIKTLKIKSKKKNGKGGSSFTVLTPQPSSIRQAITINRDFKGQATAVESAAIAVRSQQSRGQRDLASEANADSRNQLFKPQKPNFGELFSDTVGSSEDGQFGY